MATNRSTIRDLVDAKSALEDQVDPGGATGTTLDNLNAAIGSIQDELAQLVLQDANAVRVPQTDPFQKATEEAQAFVATLNTIKAAFNGVDRVVNAIIDVIKYIV